VTPDRVKAILTGLRVLWVILLTAGIVAVWYKTDYPWDEGCRTYVCLHVILGAFVLLRVIRWPDYLWLAFLTWFLAVFNWRIF